MDGFLDLARSIFCRLTEQIHDLAESLRTQLELPSLKVLPWLCTRNCGPNRSRGQAVLTSPGLAPTLSRNECPFYSNCCICMMPAGDIWLAAVEWPARNFFWA